ncbi:MAG: PKD domain-containing protein [Bacteroidetes bacterium]|nr:PKD domain-containing protein [Bacteroidota bacterium]
MKIILTRAFFLFVTSFLVINTSVFSQLTINGPFQICPGACYDYTASSQDITWTYDISGSTSGITALINGNTIQFCISDFVQTQTTIFLLAVDSQTGETAGFDILVGFNIDINILNPSCISTNQPLTLETDLVPTPGSSWNYIWSGPNGFLSTEANPIIQNFTTDMAGTYCIEIFNQTDCSGAACLNISPTDLEIIPTSLIFCEQDSFSINPCQKVCANSQMIYEVEGASSGTDVEWQVFGAQAYEVNGSQITVDWGGPGQGEITAEVSDGNNFDPFQAWCGESNTATPNGGGVGYIHIDGGQGLYDITLLNPTGNIQFGSISEGTFEFTNLFPGTYIVEVSQNGIVVFTCDFFIAESGVPNQCHVSGFFEEVQHASDCNACDGFVSLAQTSGNWPFNYQWSNGSNTPSQDGLCPGNYSLTITDEFGCTKELSVTIGCPQNCSTSTSYCVDIIEEPNAKITTIPAAVNNIIEICEGQTVFFQNESTNAETFIWEFGDFNTSTQFEPNHTYQNPGTYTLSLIARNKCFCADTTQFTVNVIDADVPEIDCVGTICEGETVTYSTTSSCGTYTWSIIGDGTILDGGGTADNFITIEWNTGPEGWIDLAVSGCSGNTCIQPNIVQIPIISDDTQIEGAQRVCTGSIEEYFITDFGGTDIFWEVSNAGLIIDGWGTNRITVNWFGAPIGDQQFVAVEFENCYLGCGGKDTLQVKIVPEFYIKGPIEVCQDESAQFYGVNVLTGGSVACDWTLEDAFGAIQNTYSNQTQPVINWNFPPGRYALSATPVNTSASCTGDYRVFVEVVNSPIAPSSITGAVLICPNDIYTYEAIGEAENTFSWIINNGGSVTTQKGNPINVNWGSSPPYSISVTQISTTGLACESDAFSMNIDLIPQAIITGTTQVCEEGSEIYSTTFHDYVDYEWSIFPGNAGTIISGQNAENIEVLWHSVGNAAVRLNLCENMTSFNVLVNPKPEPNIIHPYGLCFGETSLIQTTTPYSNYIWKNETGSVVSNDPTPILTAGFYKLEVVDNLGCVGENTFEIESYELPVVSISVPIYLGFCIGGPTATIYATASGDGYDYQWLFNGSPVGSNTPTWTTNIPGTYQVIVTDQNGCVSNSNILVLGECEAEGGLCVNGICTPPECNNPNSGCAPGGTISFDIVPTNDCLIHDYLNTSTNFIPGSLNWRFGDPASGANNFSTLENPSHTFTEPGYYAIILTGQVPDLNDQNNTCSIGQISQDIIYAIADFEFEKACPGGTTEFIDISNHMEFTSITAWDWNFGDPTSGASNTSNSQNPTHVYNDIGNYNVTLTITSSEGCESTISKIVDVYSPPTVSFDLPTESCQGLALNFMGNISGDVTSVSWDFGDPTSADANTSELFNTYHAFETPGIYTIFLTAESVFGCTNVYSQNLTVEANSLSGEIQFSQPSPICEGDQIILTSPPGGISWEWSDGSTDDNVIVSKSSVWNLTITDNDGCTYSPNSAIIDVFDSPNGKIQAVEYNEFGQPVGLFDENYSVCEGEDVTLIISGSLNYNYLWSNGQTGDEISFTDEKGNTLPQGDHPFSVTVTDNTNGCTAIEGPFMVTVHPLPDNIQILSNPNGPLCENNSAILFVNNPDGSLTYLWNTGEIGTSIGVVAGGTYFARAINQFGCSSESNHLVIQNAPDINKIPGGCHSRCVPDTICLPNIPNVASYQWYFDGSPIPASNGTVPDLIADQSGEYYVEMTDWWGCTATSGILTLDLFDGFGSILGEVYFDVNQNGVIDASDTLVSDVNIFINNSISNLDTVSSNAIGNYAFTNILSTDYTLILDTLNLPTGWSAIYSEVDISLIGCDVEEQVNWLLTKECISPQTDLEFNVCEGDSIEYEGIFLIPNTIQSFTHTNVDNCDSTVNVSVLELQKDTMPMLFEICQNETITYDGVILSAGDMMDFVFVNEVGCDSTVHVMVDGFDLDSENVNFSTCSNGSVDYEGITLFPGDIQDFNFKNQFGCDSIVTVSVMAVPPDSTMIPINVCENESTIYEGIELFPGDNQFFTLQDLNGCDSIVEVMVSGIPLDAVLLSLNACTGGTIIYEGATLAPGDIQNFTFPNQNGCDSTVTVSVMATPPDSTMMLIDVCENESTTFGGVELFLGDNQFFTLQDLNGCDSIVEVQVLGLPLDAVPLTLIACENSSIIYEGQTLFPGDIQDFKLSNQNGCDSTVTVTVDSAPIHEVDITIQACEDFMATYEGQDLAIGSQTPFIYQNIYGCDSTVLVNVDAFPASSFDLMSNTICINGSDGQIEVTNIQGNSTPYSYSLDGINFQNTPVFTDLNAENYTITVQDGNACEFDENITILTLPELQIQVEDQIIPCEKGEVRLSPTLISGDASTLSFKWSDGSTSPTFMVRDAGIYTLEVSDQCETISHDIEVTWGIDSQTSFIYMPNAFSPNGDGANDFYKGYLANGVDLLEYNLMIFDRWGNLLFETDNIDTGWNGELNARDLDTNVFVFWLKYKVFNCGKEFEVFEKRDVVLMR